MRSNDAVAAKTLALVLAGGAGRRLYPLTRYRPKPLVPFGGCFRILDFTLSNCFNSGLDRAYVLTQQDSESMADYLARKWNRFGPTDRDFAIPCPPSRHHRYAGTADAILQNLSLVQEQGCKFALVVSADHVYKMDYRRLLEFHAASGAAATIATVDYPRELCSQVGVVECDQDDRVAAFVEKPRESELRSNKPTVQVNMGVYVFNCDILHAAAQTRRDRLVDISLDLIPRLMRSHTVCAYRHEDGTSNKALYWRDVGTLEAYYDASMDLLGSDPPIDPHDSNWPIHSVVGSRFGRCTADAYSYQSVLSPGVVLEPDVDVRHSVLLPGAIVRRGAMIQRTIVDANVIIEAGDCIGYDDARDKSRFHVLSNGIVVVSPDCLPTTCNPERPARNLRERDNEVGEFIPTGESHHAVSQALSRFIRPAESRRRLRLHGF